MIRLAKLSDLDEVINIIEATRPLLLKQGSKQWNTSDNYPNKSTFTNDINNNILYVIDECNSIQAVFALTTSAEENYNTLRNGEWINKTNNYAVIHRLAINPSSYNKGLASKIIEFVKIYCFDNSIKSIKVDTHPKNSPMNNLLLKMNFLRCGEIFLSRTLEDNIRIAYELVLNSNKKK